MDFIQFRSMLIRFLSQISTVLYGLILPHLFNFISFFLYPKSNKDLNDNVDHNNRLHLESIFNVPEISKTLIKGHILFNPYKEGKNPLW